MKSIVWLASYPKSGNTWLRAFLANYIRNSDEPVPLNKIRHLGIGDSSALLYEKVAKKPFDINNPSETAHIRSDVLQAVVNNRADVNFVKTHCLNGAAFGVQLIPTQLTRSAIYILRNPLDVTVSFASHYGLSIDETIQAMHHNDLVLPGGDDNASQFVGAWSNHVLGWTKARKFPVLALRYEDILDDPCQAFVRVIQHIGLPVDQDRLEQAVRFSDFKALSNQENKTTFIENSENQERFFRSGKSGQWKTELTSKQADTICQNHSAIMKKHGYL